MAAVFFPPQRGGESLKCKKPRVMSYGLLSLLLCLSAYPSRADTTLEDDLALALMHIDNSLIILGSIDGSTQQLQNLQTTELQSLEDLSEHEMNLSQLVEQDQQNLTTLKTSLENYQSTIKSEEIILRSSNEIIASSEKILEQQERRFTDTLGGKLLLYVGVPLVVGCLGFGAGYIMGSL